MATSVEGSTWTMWEDQNVTQTFTTSQEKTFAPVTQALGRYVVMVFRVAGSSNLIGRTVNEIASLKFDYNDFTYLPKNLAASWLATDAANKGYVDSHAHTSPMTICTSTIASTGTVALSLPSALPASTSLVSLTSAGALQSGDQTIGHNLTFAVGATVSKMQSNMTTNPWTSGGYTYTASADGRWQNNPACDNASTCIWAGSLGVTGKTIDSVFWDGNWAQIDFGRQVQLTAYYVTAANNISSANSLAPGQWAMAVSSNGSTWTMWHNQSVTQAFTVSEEKAYTPTAVACRYAVMLIKQCGSNNYTSRITCEIASLKFDFKEFLYLQKNLAAPSLVTDAANKGYVDSHAHTSPMTIGTSTIASTGTVALSLPSALPASTSLTSLTSAGQLSASALKVPVSLPSA
eukprot:g74499.t1